MPPKLKMNKTDEQMNRCTDDRERRYKLMLDGVVVATGTLQDLGLSGTLTACELAISPPEPEFTMPFEEIFKDE